MNENHYEYIAHTDKKYVEDELSGKLLRKIKEFIKNQEN